MKNRYCLIEEYRVGTVPGLYNTHVPTLITGYGKVSWEKEKAYLLSTEWSHFSEVKVVHFYSNKTYNEYIRKMQRLGSKIEYNNLLKTTL